jgi:hypothetical protein
LCMTRLCGPFTATTDAPLVVAVIPCPGHNTRSFTSAPIGPEPGKRFPIAVLGIQNISGDNPAGDPL